MHHQQQTTNDYVESEEDTLPKDLEQGRGKKDDTKRRPSLAQKMTSNLRRFSGVQNAEHKIDISEPSPTNNPKFCHKKIKVSGEKKMEYRFGVY